MVEFEGSGVSDQTMTRVRAACSDWQGKSGGECEGTGGFLGEEEVGGFVEEVFLSMSRLTGTNLQYHLLGDLMVDDDRTTTGENVRC